MAMKRKMKLISCFLQHCLHAELPRVGLIQLPLRFKQKIHSLDLVLMMLLLLFMQHIIMFHIYAVHFLKRLIYNVTFKLNTIIVFNNFLSSFQLTFFLFTRMFRSCTSLFIHFFSFFCRASR